jgi:hypothetical protein
MQRTRRWRSGWQSEISGAGSLIWNVGPTLSVMDISPTAKQERFFRRLLIPFKAYVIVAAVWLFYSALEAHSKHEVLGGLSADLLITYAVCIPFFAIAALVQFIAHWRRPALVSILFAFAASIVLAILWQIIASAVT